jgi:hypothetical protein
MGLLIDTDRARDALGYASPFRPHRPGRHHHRTQPATPANRMNTPGSSRGHQRAVLMAPAGGNPWSLDIKIEAHAHGARPVVVGTSQRTAILEPGRCPPSGRSRRRSRSTGSPRGWNHYRVSQLCYGIKHRYGPPVDLGYVPGSPAKKALFRNRNVKARRPAARSNGSSI